MGYSLKNSAYLLYVPVLKFNFNLFLYTGSGQVPVGYVGKVLSGFAISSKPLKPRRRFDPPPLPRDFKPVHTFMKPAYGSTVPSSGGQRSEVKRDAMNAVSRGLVLGDTPNMSMYQVMKSIIESMQ